MKEAVPMTTARAVADYLILKADADGRPVDQLKLQKLVYYAQAYHLAAFEQPLFSDAVEAWKYGPAVWSVYSQFKQYGRTPIGPSIACQPEQDEATRRWLDEVWNAFGGFTGTQLANRTHEEPPYTDAWARRRSDRSREVIPYEAMREHYVDHYEDWQPGYATAMASAYEAVDATRAKATAHTYRVSLRAVYHG
jgi:uncharacterized phage-associated protein